MSKIAVYFSPTGGTKKVIDIFSREFCCETEIDLTDSTQDYSRFSFKTDDICLLAVPSFSGRVPEIAAQRIRQMNGNRAIAVLIAVFGNRAIDDTLIELKDVLTARGFRCAGAVEAVAQHSIMHQFANARPDDKDILELHGFAEKIKNKIESNENNNFYIPGNRLYKEFGDVPLKPNTNSKCTKCVRCAELCPVGAINTQKPNETDKHICISCMRCVYVCTNHARNLNPVVLKAAELGMQKACKQRKDNRLYL